VKLPSVAFTVCPVSGLSEIDMFGEPLTAAEDDEPAAAVLLEDGELPLPDLPHPAVVPPRTTATSATPNVTVIRLFATHESYLS
jgi:hypothetical protein